MKVLNEYLMTWNTTTFDSPVFKETNTSVILTLKNNIIMRRTRKSEHITQLISSEWDRFKPDEKYTLELIYAKGELRTGELAEHLGKSPNYSRRILNKLTDKSLLKLIASSTTDPKQYYMLNNSNKSIQKKNRANRALKTYYAQLGGYSARGDARDLRHLLNTALYRYNTSNDC